MTFFVDLEHYTLVWLTLTQQPLSISLICLKISRHAGFCGRLWPRQSDIACAAVVRYWLRRIWLRVDLDLRR